MGKIVTTLAASERFVEYELERDITPLAVAVEGCWRREINSTMLAVGAARPRLRPCGVAVEGEFCSVAIHGFAAAVGTAETPAAGDRRERQFGADNF